MARKSRSKKIDERVIQLPESLAIGPFVYAVRLMPEIKAVEQGVLGLCDRHDNVIQIKQGLNPQTTAEVLLHEVMHAVFFASGLDHLEGVNKEEEAIVCQLTIGLLTAIRQNPSFIPTLLELIDAQ